MSAASDRSPTSTYEPQPPSVDEPPPGTADLPSEGFHACGSLDPLMWVRECFFQAGGKRRDADRIQSANGRWHATFTNIPETESGILFVVAENDTPPPLIGFSDGLLVNPPLESVAGSLEITGPLDLLQIHVTNPHVGSAMTQGYTATGALDSGTK